MAGMYEEIYLTESQKMALDAAQEEEKEKAVEAPKKWGTADDLR